MKKFHFIPVSLRTMVCLTALVFLAGVTHAQTLRVEAQVVWGTDDAQSPNPRHHPVDADLARRLSKAPFRWKNYFEVNRQVVEVAVGETKTNVPMSKRCTLDIKNLGNNRVEVKLHGDGKPVSTHRESLANNGLLVLSGPDANNNGTAWLVTIRKSKPEGKPANAIATTNRP